MGDIQAWIDGIAAMGCRFVELVKDGKRPRRTLDHYEHMTGAFGVQCALGWLAKGSPVGFMPKLPFWILDADSTDQVKRVVWELMDRRISPLMVSTPRGGAHFYGILPNDFPLEGLKNHHPDGMVPMDYKFGPSTIVVCPGSSRKGIAYLPALEWSTPPVVDPRWFKTDGFWHKRDDRPFLTNSRSLENRLMAARQYLKTRAPTSVSGDGGHQVLAHVCSHLVAYHLISPRTALTMLAEWNRRCRDKAEKPCPWSRSELISALDAARDSVPEAGVRAYQDEEANRVLRERVSAHVQIIKATLTLDESAKVSVQRVRRILRWFGLDLSETGLGRAMRLAGVDRKRKTKARIWHVPKMDYRKLVSGLLADRRGTAGRDLNKQAPVLPRICPLLSQVEQVVSEKTAA